MSDRERVVPFWFLNDRLEKNRLTSQLEAIRGKGVREVIVHPRYGLPDGMYLNREWFDHVGHVVNDAARLGMRVWIHDDINWPGGTVGGELTGKNGHAAKVIGFKNGRVENPRKSSFQIAYQHTPYLDVLDSSATSAFVSKTHEQYKVALGRHFGKTIQGFYTDEPGFYANAFNFVDRGTLPFTDDLFDEFRHRRGYDPEGEMSYIWQEAGARSRRIRQDYFQTVSELYQERFLGRLANWCHQNNLKFIGHLLEEEDPLNLIKSQGDPFAAASHFDWAGYDLISALTENHSVSAAFARSVAEIYGKPEVMTEAMGGFGWEMPPEKMLEVADWLASHGTSVVVPHALFYSVRGDRKHESPPSLMEEPYWSRFGEFSETFSQKVDNRERENKDRAIYYPTQALWAMYNPADERAARRISETVRRFSLEYAKAGIEFDYITDDSIANADFGRDAHWYEWVCVPSADIVPIETMRRFKEFADNAKRITFVGSYPQFAAKTEDQEEFDQLKGALNNHELHRVDFMDLNVPNSTQISQLAGLQYRVWHELSCLSPRYSDLLIQAKHKLMKR